MQRGVGHVRPGRAEAAMQELQAVAQRFGVLAPRQQRQAMLPERGEDGAVGRGA